MGENLLKSLPRERSECFGHYFHRAAAFTAGFDVDAEYSFQALSPGHGCPPFGGRLVLPLIGCPGLIALAPPGRRHPRTVLTVRCKQAKEKRDSMAPNRGIENSRLTLRLAGGQII
jgi:hypothetical protein